MGVSKVDYGDRTLIDLTQDTVTADKLMQGYTAHGANGEQIVGTATGGSGDMLQADYDSDSTVKNGGGIKAWVQSLGYITGLAWSALTGKPFNTIGAGLYVNNGTLKAICENFGVGNRGTASASEVREQYVRLNDATYRIDRTIYMQYSQTLSTTTDTVYTFNHGLISANGVIEVFTDIFGINPSNIVTTNGQCVVTFPKQSTAQTMTCRIYISME